MDPNEVNDVCRLQRLDLLRKVAKCRPICFLQQTINKYKPHFAQYIEYCPIVLWRAINTTTN